MTYFASNGYLQPRPYITTDKYNKMPGWGLSLEHAGPPMIAVGSSPDGLGAARINLSGQKCALAFAIEKLCSEGKNTNASTCGQAASTAYGCRTQGQSQQNTAPGVAEDPMSYWVWVACGAIILGAGGLLAYNQGWFGKKKAVAMTANRWRRRTAAQWRKLSIQAEKMFRKYLRKGDKERTEHYSTIVDEYLRRMYEAEMSKTGKY